MKEITVRTSTTRGEETKCCRTFGSVLDRFPFVLVEPPFSFVCSFSFPFSVSFSFSFDAIDFFDGPASALVEDEPFVSFAAAFFSHLDATRSSLRLAEVRGTSKVTCVYQHNIVKTPRYELTFRCFLLRFTSTSIEFSHRHVRFLGALFHSVGSSTLALCDFFDRFGGTLRDGFQTFRGWFRRFGCFRLF